MRFINSCLLGEWETAPSLGMGLVNPRVRLTWRYCTPTATMPHTANGANDNGPSTEEPDDGKACPEPVEGSHVRFGSGGGVGNRPADHNQAGTPGALITLGDGHAMHGSELAARRTTTPRIILGRELDYICFSNRMYSSWSPIQNQVTVPPSSQPKAR